MVRGRAPLLALHLSRGNDRRAPGTKGQDDRVDPPANQGLSALAMRWERLARRVADAAARAGRDGAAIRLVAVTKLVDDATVLEAIALGLTDLGENRVQNLLARPDAITAQARMHLIGPLQTNKVKKAVGAMAEFHALERVELVPLLDREAAAVGKVLPVWLQVNVAREPQKHGCAPESAAELAGRIAAAPRLQLRGLMTIAPLAEEAEASRAHFRALAALSTRLLASGALPSGATGLSMGMSNDFEVAVEEGATSLRVGSALFAEDGA